ncbi:hypothetical protein ACSBQ7_09520 [Staphylococcus equorum]
MHGDQLETFDSNYVTSRNLGSNDAMYRHLGVNALYEIVRIRPN